MKRRGMTAVEMMSVLIIMSFLLTALYRVFFSGQRQAREIMENHIVNDEIQRVVDRVTDDLREGNYVNIESNGTSELPRIVDIGSENSLQTRKGPALQFYKVNFDFSKNMSSMSGKTRCFTIEEINYSLEGPGGPTTDGPPWALVREMVPWDDQNNARRDQAKTETLLDGMDECVFYRLKNPTDNSRSPGMNNVFLRVAVKRTDPNLPPERRYSAKVVTSVKCRGSEPEGLGGMAE